VCLGVSVEWNKPEYLAMGMDFTHTMNTFKTKSPLLHNCLKQGGRKIEDRGIGFCIVEPDADKNFDATDYIKHIQDWRQLGVTPTSSSSLSTPKKRFKYTSTRFSGLKSELFPPSISTRDIL